MDDDVNLSELFDFEGFNRTLQDFIAADSPEVRAAMLRAIEAATDPGVLEQWQQWKNRHG